MLRSLYAAVQQRRWSRDRSRRIAAMQQRERTIALADPDRLDAMAWQLAEIRALPEGVGAATMSRTPGACSSHAPR